MDHQEISNIVNYVIGIYALLLMIVATLGNIFLLLMCLITELKKTPTFIFLAFMAACDCLSLYWWNLDHFLTPYFNIDRQNEDIAWCKIDTFIEFSVLEGSAWLLVTWIPFKKISLLLKNKWISQRWCCHLIGIFQLRSKVGQGHYSTLNELWSRLPYWCRFYLCLI